MIKLILNDFNIEQIALSGQCFRWNKLSDKKYIGVFCGHVCKIEQNENEITFSGLSEEEFNDLGVEYFDIKRDYKEIKDSYENDDVLRKAIESGSGIRILNQDKFETLISFIISANNNIPRIKKTIEKISERYGKKIYLNNEVYFAFPTPEELSIATEEELRAFGSGFRDKYIKKACDMIRFGEINLEKISQLPTDECKKELMKIPGVGPKVADCVMLFSMQKTDAFPIDVWIKRIMEELYFKEEKTLKEIGEFAKEKFGKYAGIAQQYLFYYARGK